MDFLDKTPIGEFFKFCPNPHIMVVDVKNLIGAYSK